jgi:hypothetical protein
VPSRRGRGERSGRAQVRLARPATPVHRCSHDRPLMAATGRRGAMKPDARDEWSARIDVMRTDGRLVKEQVQRSMRNGPVDRIRVVGGSRPTMRPRHAREHQQAAWAFSEVAVRRTASRPMLRTRSHAIQVRDGSDARVLQQRGRQLKCYGENGEAEGDERECTERDERRKVHQSSRPQE